MPSYCAITAGLSNKYRRNLTSNEDDGKSYFLSYICLHGISKSFIQKIFIIAQLCKILHNYKYPFSVNKIFENTCQNMPNFVCLFKNNFEVVSSVLSKFVCFGKLVFRRNLIGKFDLDQNLIGLITFFFNKNSWFNQYGLG